MNPSTDVGKKSLPEIIRNRLVFNLRNIIATESICLILVEYLEVVHGTIYCTLSCALTFTDMCYKLQKIMPCPVLNFDC